MQVREGGEGWSCLEGSPSMVGLPEKQCRRRMQRCRGSRRRWLCVEATGESRRVEPVWEESEKSGTAFDLMWEGVM